MVRRSIFSLLILFYFTSSYSRQAVAQDTFPRLDIRIDQRIDTVTIFDYDTGEQETRVVENSIEMTEVFDTTSVFDYNKYEETITIKKHSISLSDYYRQYGAERCKQIERYLEELNSNETLKKDTLIVFDPETYKETLSIIPVRSDCFHFIWGGHFLSHLHTIKSSDFNKMLRSKISVSSSCDNADSFSCRLVSIPVGHLPWMMKISNERNDLSRMKISKYPMMSGSRILIEDIRVNGEQIIDAVVIKLEN